ncbi:MAG: Phosphoribosyl-AMP cyclohydrolase [Candidatus Methanolliviera sp. GoM_asphalt]|nr:MAG: Phosphoribosyl-AMP cyclohydrolase [Candidatus Methanolliviera sp. GoM_asphalt]
MKDVDLKFSDGLIPVIVQDVENEEVLMMAYMNEEALKRTLDTGKAHYWSRSRGKLWLKGEESGNFQSVREIRVDCDGDTILLKVKQIGGACHKGYRSCFYRRMNGDIVSEKVFDPSKVYRGEN